MEGAVRKEEAHWMECPVCHDLFDLRDLAAVVQHEHWMEEKPRVFFSRSGREGLRGEVYIKVGAKMITLKLPPASAGGGLPKKQ